MEVRLKATSFQNVFICILKYSNKHILFFNDVGHCWSLCQVKSSLLLYTPPTVVPEHSYTIHHIHNKVTLHVIKWENIYLLHINKHRIHGNTWEVH
jgi:hypothetical protein